MSLSDENIHACIRYITNPSYISYDKDIIINPCAGTGNLIEHIGPLARFTFSYDVTNPSKRPDIRKLDFRTVDYKWFDRTKLAGLWYNRVHIISCPNAIEAEAYLIKCAEFADTIAFILPKALIIHFQVPPEYTIKLFAEIDDKWLLKIWDRTVSINWN
jgi:hypothetical protein